MNFIDETTLEPPDRFRIIMWSSKESIQQQTPWRSVNCDDQRPPSSQEKLHFTFKKLRFCFSFIIYRPHRFGSVIGYLRLRIGMLCLKYALCLFYTRSAQRLWSNISSNRAKEQKTRALCDSFTVNLPRAYERWHQDSVEDWRWNKLSCMNHGKEYINKYYLRLKMQLTLSGTW